MAEYICSFCGWEGIRKKQLRGSRGVEIFIWSVLFFPGPIYSMWRRMGRVSTCPNCQLPKLVKLESDAGQAARRKFDVEMGLIAAPKSAAFAQDKPAAQPATKKPVNPEEW